MTTSDARSVGGYFDHRVDLLQARSGQNEIASFIESKPAPLVFQLPPVPQGRHFPA